MMNTFPLTNILKTKTDNKLIYLNYYEPKKEYLLAKKNVFYYDESYKDKMLISGIMAKKFLDCLFKKTISFNSQSFYDLIYIKFKNYIEVQIIFLDYNKYMLVANDLRFLIKTFKKIKKNLKKVQIFDVSKAYKLYSIYNCNDSKISLLTNIKPIKTNYQNITYYNIIINSNDKEKHQKFIQANFLKVGLETINAFLYNNNVIPYFNNLKNQTKKIIASIFYGINIKNKYKIIKVELIESPLHNNYIYSITKKRIGLILNTYYQFNKKYPFALALVPYNYSDKYLFLRHKRKYYVGRKINIFSRR